MAAADIEANNNPDVKASNGLSGLGTGTGAGGVAKPTKTTTSRWTQSVSAKYTDLICLVCCFITGLCDSAAYNAWSCFLAMQTGNTIFLGLGASDQPTGKPWGWLKSLVSIVSFFIGALLFSLYGRNLGPKKRMTLFTSFLFQAILVIIAVALLEGDLIPHDIAETSSLTGGRLFLELIPIALLAFQSAGSMTAARGLGYNEIPTVVLTSVYFDVASDPKLVRDVAGNVKRNRRVGSVVLLLVGAIVGGWLSRSSGGMESALWLSAGLKGVIALGWLVWVGE
ncbi:YoaK family protein [Aspergillus undulatus]|uniref:YoaK family protein n=1 Tax=Aspergillus undulatus TaxID=1810928 RepID=UPI003CCE3E46